MSGNDERMGFTLIAYGIITVLIELGRGEEGRGGEGKGRRGEGWEGMGEKGWRRKGIGVEWSGVEGMGWEKREGRVRPHVGIKGRSGGMTAREMPSNVQMQHVYM